MIKQFLDDLESRIDTDVEETLHADWKTFLDGRWTEDIFAPRRQAAPPKLAWPDVRVNESLDAFETMALQQLASSSYMLDKGTGYVLNVRANFGTGTLSSLFGAEIYRMDDVYNTLPTTLPLTGGADAIRRLLDQGMPDLTSGYGGRCLDFYRYYAGLIKDYPRISRYVFIYHPDLQGPMDITELLWGSGLFLDLVDEPELVHALLKLVTETYIRFMREWEKIVPPKGDHAAHWGLLHKGRIMLRDDSAMNLSPEMFDTFIRPYDQRLLSVFNGGAIHYCGRGDHYIASLSEMTGVNGVNVSQPHLNDMERIYQNTVDKGIPLLGLRRDAADAALARGRDLHGRVHCPS